jgi:hypothetical protein
MPIREKQPMFNLNYKLVPLAVLASYAAVGQDNPISVSLATKAATYQALGDAELEIRISNTSGQPVTVQTIDADPPITPHALNDRGENAIITRPAIKRGDTRNREFVLSANEAKRYEVKLRDVLGKEQELPPPSPGAVSLYLYFPIVSYRDGAYKVDLVRSNSVKIQIEPAH